MPASTLLLAVLLAPQGEPADPSAAFFARVRVVQVELRLDEASRQALRERPREYAKASVVVDGETFTGCGVKLKGAAGSTRDFDDRTGFTVHLGKFGGTGRLAGQKRFHLNNGVQDDSRLSEWLGAEIFARAGHPAPRVAHARVREGDRELGIYVFREAFDEPLLQRAFGTFHGNLYDGGFCQDVDQELEKDLGDGDDDRKDLARLCDVSKGTDGNRAAELAKVLDLDRFLEFAALEAILGHWDGYTKNANNYRLAIARTGRATFLPHGMDQLVQDPEWSVLDHPPAIVASAVMQQPALRKRYRERLRALAPLLAADDLEPRLRERAAAIGKAWRAFDETGARAHEAAVDDFVSRLAQRARSLKAQVVAPEPKPLPLAVGKSHALKALMPAAETEGIEVGKKSFAGAAAYHVAVVSRGEEPRHGAFRCHLLLGKGRYALRGVARCADVVPPPADENGPHGGVSLRADGQPSKRLSGDANWTELEVEFEVAEFQRQVELACDAEMHAGRAWFRLESLKLVRLGD